MSFNVEATRIEVTTDPLARGYAAMSDAEVLTSLTAVDRDNPSAMEDIIGYMLDTRTHTNTGQDTAANNTTPSILLGRLIHVAEQTGVELALPIDVFGATKTLTNLREWHSAKAFLEMIRRGIVPSKLMTESEQGNILNDLINCGVMTAADRTAIIALSQNQISRAAEQGLGAPSEADIAYVRAL